MSGSQISIERIIEKLDRHLNKNDYISAEQHLLYWLGESTRASDLRAELLVRNELMGLYRKTGRKEEAIDCVSVALAKIEELKIGHQVGAATTFLNAATVYKAFGYTEESLSLFIRAKEVYEKELEPYDARLGGLYNNMALTLVDLRRFDDAEELYDRAITVMSHVPGRMLDVAITHLNRASAAEAQHGLEESEATVSVCLDKAEKILEECTDRNGYYAFVCEKCASVFEYYGHFLYAKELKSRAERIYGNEGN